MAPGLITTPGVKRIKGKSGIAKADREDQLTGAMTLVRDTAHCQ